MAEINLSDPRLGRLIWRLGLPAMAGLMLNATHQVVDAAFVGWLGADELAVLALLAPLGGLTVAAGVGLGVGAASALARALGAGEPEEARRIAGTVFAAGLGAALLAVLILSALREPALGLVGMPAPLLDPARSYYPALLMTLGFGMIQIVCDFLAIGRGDSRFSLKTLALCFGLNICSIRSSSSASASASGRGLGDLDRATRPRSRFGPPISAHPRPRPRAGTLRQSAPDSARGSARNGVGHDHHLRHDGDSGVSPPTWGTRRRWRGSASRCD